MPTTKKSNFIAPPTKLRRAVASPMDRNIYKNKKDNTIYYGGGFDLNDESNRDLEIIGQMAHTGQFFNCHTQHEQHHNFKKPDHDHDNDNGSSNNKTGSIIQSQ